MAAITSFFTGPIIQVVNLTLPHDGQDDIFIGFAL